MDNRILETSQKFWRALEAKDTSTMRSICDPACYFVHIGGNCDLDKEMDAFDKGVFQPTEIKINSQEVHLFDNIAICITDCDYGLLLDGAPTTHHFAVTEVYQQQVEGWKLVQFTFTALVY